MQIDIRPKVSPYRRNHSLYFNLKPNALFRWYIDVIPFDISFLRYLNILIQMNAWIILTVNLAILFIIKWRALKMVRDYARSLNAHTMSIFISWRQWMEPAVQMELGVEWGNVYKTTGLHELQVNKSNVTDISGRNCNKINAINYRFISANCW